jgi:hypothetical protein
MANVQEYESEIRDLAVKKETAAKMMTLLQWSTQYALLSEVLDA